MNVRSGSRLVCCCNQDRGDLPADPCVAIESCWTPQHKACAPYLTPLSHADKERVDQTKFGRCLIDSNTPLRRVTGMDMHQGPVVQQHSSRNMACPTPNCCPIPIVLSNIRHANPTVLPTDRHASRLVPNSWHQARQPQHQAQRRDQPTLPAADHTQQARQVPDRTNTALLPRFC